MAGYTSPCLDAPRREMAEYRHELRGRRILLLHRQLAAEDAGNIAAAADCLRRIASVEARLRAIDEAGR